MERMLLDGFLHRGEADGMELRDHLRRDAVQRSDGIRIREKRKGADMVDMRMGGDERVELGDVFRFEICIQGRERFLDAAVDQQVGAVRKQDEDRISRFA